MSLTDRFFRYLADRIYARMTISPERDNALDLGETAAQWRKLYLSGQLISTVATGTAPLSVASTTKVTNLNADTVDGIDGHARSHAITGTSDHTSTATSGKMLKADANGLPVDATNTDAQVAAAVTASHAAVTVTDTATLNLTLTGQDIKGDVTIANHDHTGDAGDGGKIAGVSALSDVDTDTYNDTAAKILGTDTDGGYRADHAEFGNITGAAEGEINAAVHVSADHMHLGSTATVYFPGGCSLYKSGTDLYWYNGTTAFKLN